MTSDRSTKSSTKQIRENSCGWMFKIVCARLDEAMNKELSELGINLPQFATMMILSERGELTQIEIGQLSNQPGYTITRNLDALEILGFVHRKPHKTSRRSHCVSLSQAGQALMPTLFEIVKQVNSKLLVGLDGDETKQFRALLGKVLSTHSLSS